MTNDQRIPANFFAMDTVASMFALREQDSGYARVRLTESGKAAPMSGIGYKLAVDFSGGVTTISGNAVTSSGDTYSLSQNSGLNGVYLTSRSGGSEFTGTLPDSLSVATIGLRAYGMALSALDRTAGTYNRLSTTVSGTAASQGGAVFRLLTCVSGDSITASGDTYIAKVSGETIRLSQVLSGFNGVCITDQPGTTPALVASWGSVDANATTLKSLFTTSMLEAFDPVGAVVNRLRTTASGTAASQNGVVFRLLTCVSGDPVTVSGSTVNNAAQVITAPAWVVITGASGGTNLASQACTIARLVNLSGNGTMLVGGTGTQAPVSGTKGIPLWQPTANVPYLDFPVTNTNLLSLVAHTSGNSVAVLTFG